MSTYNIAVALSLTANGLRAVEGANTSDPFRYATDPDTFSTDTANKQHGRKAINLNNGQSITLDPASFTQPLGDAGAVSFVQTWLLANTAAEGGGTLRMTFGNDEYVEVRPGAFVCGSMPLRNIATQTGWDISPAWSVDCVGGSATGVLVVIGSPSA